jgi:hypothetical protein
MVKEPGKAKKMKAPIYHKASKSFSRKRFGKVDQDASPSQHFLPPKFNSHPLTVQDSDDILINCVKNVLRTLRIDTYMRAMEQFNHLYDYVTASISFGEYEKVK